MRIDELIPEFEMAFETYVRSNADSRRAMLDSMLAGTPAKMVAEMMEASDFAAILSCAVFGKKITPEGFAFNTAFENESNISKEMVLGAIEVDNTIDGIEEYLEQMTESEEGVKFLSEIVACLMAAHDIEGLRMNLWDPSK